MSNKKLRLSDNDDHYPNFSRSQFISSVSYNNHLQQMNGMTIPTYDYSMLTRKLDENCSRLPYRRREGEQKSVVHWGQRKLLISEIEFLTIYAEEGITCVYAGAAPGTHIPFIAELFPEVHFLLIDPAHFSIASTAQVTIIQEFMTEKVAEDLSHMKTLLISDIRSADYRVMDEEKLEESIKRDMEWQMKWFINLKSIAGLLKFRLPWTSGFTTYLKGHVYFPVWGPPTTTEGRLLVTSSELCEWDNKKYEEQMFYFNTVTRVSAYDHDVISPGLDYCYDCTSEVIILKAYLQSTLTRAVAWSTSDESNKDSNRIILIDGKVIIPNEKLANMTSCLIENITEACNGSRRADEENYRTLINWKKNFVFPLRMYDVENLEVYEFSQSDPNLIL